MDYAHDQAAAGGEVPGSGLDNEAYQTLFGSPLGRAVLADLYDQFNVGPRWIPGEGVEAGYLREGQANVIEQIMARMAAAQQEVLNG
jgi:hypothetical protein